MSEAVYRFINSLNEIENQYSNIQLAKPTKQKTSQYKKRDYTYYGKALVKRGLEFKIQLIFQIIGSALLVPLTFGLIFTVKSFKPEFKHKIKQLSEPNEKIKIYVLNQLQEQVSNDNALSNTTKRTGQKEEQPQNINIETLENQSDSDQISSTTPVDTESSHKQTNPFPKLDWQEFKINLSHRVPLTSKQEISEDILNSSLTPQQEISEEEALNRELENEDISSCFKQYSTEKYISVCKALVSKYQDPLDPRAEKKLTTMMEDIRDKRTINIWDFENIEKIYSAIFDACTSIDQMMYIMQFNIGKIYLDCPLKIIYERGWIEEYVQKADMSLVKNYLTPKPALYFALKNAYIAQNKYEEFLEVLTEGQRDSMAIVTEKGFIIPDPTRLPIEFHTKVTDSNGNQINVSIYDMHKKREFYPLYQLRTDDGKILGDISLKPYRKEYLSINAMQSHSKDSREYRGVGTALHEFAIQKSFLEGCNGKVQLNAAYNSDLFHFMFGYRYLNPLARTFPLVGSDFSSLVEAYFAAKKNHQPTEDILSSISSYFEKKNNNKNIALQLQKFTHWAKKALKREPENIQEIIENGYYYDLNEYGEKVLAKSPLYHPELGPLLKKYQTAKKNHQPTDEIIQRIKTLQNQADPDLQKFFDRLRKVAIEELEIEPKNLQQPENLQQILDNGIKEPRFFNEGGWMSLSDQTIQKWKQTLGIE